MPTDPGVTLGTRGGVHGTYVEYLKRLEKALEAADEMARFAYRGEWEGWAALQEAREKYLAARAAAEGVK